MKLSSILPCILLGASRVQGEFQLNYQALIALIALINLISLKALIADSSDKSDISDSSDCSDSSDSSDSFPPLVPIHSALSVCRTVCVLPPAGGV